MANTPSLECYELNHLAFGEHKKAVADRMGLTYETIRLQTKAPKESYFGKEEINWWQRFQQQFLAVLAVNPAGAAMYLDVLNTAYQANRSPENLGDADWYAEVGRTAKETSEAVVAACNNRSVNEVQKEIREAIVQLERLAAITAAKSSETPLRSVS
jgi:hypothetical protein